MFSVTSPCRTLQLLRKAVGTLPHRLALLMAVIALTVLFVAIAETGNLNAATAALNTDSPHEAEGGVLTYPMIAVADSSASGGSYVVQSASVSERNGSATYRFYIPQPGRFQVKGKVETTSSSSNSYQLIVDSHSSYTWAFQYPLSQWTWVFGPEFELTSGYHSIVLMNQEPNTKIDKIELRTRELDATIASPPPSPTPSATPSPTPSATPSPTPSATPSPTPIPAATNLLYVSTTGSDSNPGTSSSPLKTLQRALDMAQPGTTILLRAGTYASNVETRREGPITVQAESGSVYLDGSAGSKNGPRIVHSYYTWKNIEIKNTNEGLRVERAHDVLLEKISVHHVKNECVRFRFASSVTYIDGLVHDCGLTGNGEGVYIGLAPEQQSKFNGNPDPTFAHIARLKAYNVSEGVDVKENARAIVEDSEVWAAWDKNSGAIDFRSDGNEAYRNYLHDNKGAGIRMGGDKRGSTSDQDCDGVDCWGRDNVLRGNRSDKNLYGYKFMWGPQDADCSNVGFGNTNGLYYYGSDVTWRLIC